MGLSLLAEGLSSLAGAALALNLGFLGLHRFEYRRQISEAAHKEFEVVRSAGQAYSDMEYYRDLGSLADLHSNGGKVVATRNPAWRVWYNSIIATHFDRQVCIGCSVLCVTVIWIGAIDEIKYLQRWTHLFPAMASRACFWALTLAVLVPPAFWFAGRKTVVAAQKGAIHCREQLQVAMKAEVRDLPTPSIKE